MHLLLACHVDMCHFKFVPPKVWVIFPYTFVYGRRSTTYWDTLRHVGFDNSREQFCMHLVISFMCFSLSTLSIYPRDSPEIDVTAIKQNFFIKNSVPDNSRNIYYAASLKGFSICSFGANFVC